MRIAGLLTWMSILWWLPGCGSADWGTVTGSVEYEGKTLKKGIVTFHPVGKTAVAYGAITDQGTFNATTGAKIGLKTGQYKVTVVDQTLPKMGTKEKATLLTPAKYASPATTNLFVTIEAGVNTLEIVLKN